MAKPLSELGDLGSEPTGGAAGLSRQALEVKRFLAHLEDLIDDGTMKWAYSTLSGIRDSVLRTGKITEGQQRAVANIRKRQTDDTQRRPTRRYEGWDPSH